MTTQPELTGTFLQDGIPTLPPASDRPALPEVAGYQIEGVLGRGGMGVVYRAVQLDLKRTVALKMIQGSRQPGPEAVGRFRAEAEALARLAHANIVQVFAVGEADGAPFLALEFCGGGNLSARLAQVPLPARAAAALVECVARAMQAAHDKGVVHRDLKPSNVLLTETGTPKVADFGLAKLLESDGATEELTASGMVLGTPSYMAPEQADGARQASASADIYSLGAILYACLTGRPPFLGATVLETLDLVRNAEPIAPRTLVPTLPRDLETICLMALRKDPARRYATARDLADDLARFLAGQPIQARPVGVVERATKWVRRNPVVATLTALVVLTLAVGVGVSTFFALRASQRADELESANRGIRLRERALEESLARSLLRAFPDARPGVLPERVVSEPERASLWELATQPTERIRWLFLANALDERLHAQQVASRPAEVLLATVGLDPERRARATERLLEAVRSATHDPAYLRAMLVVVANWEGATSDLLAETLALAAEADQRGIQPEKLLARLRQRPPSAVTARRIIPRLSAVVTKPRPGVYRSPLLELLALALAVLPEAERTELATPVAEALLAEARRLPSADVVRGLVLVGRIAPGAPAEAARMAVGLRDVTGLAFDATGEGRPPQYDVCAPWLPVETLAGAVGAANRTTLLTATNYAAPVTTFALQRWAHAAARMRPDEASRQAAEVCQHLTAQLQQKASPEVAGIWVALAPYLPVGVARTQAQAVAKTGPPVLALLPWLDAVDLERWTAQALEVVKAEQTKPPTEALVTALRTLAAVAERLPADKARALALATNALVALENPTVQRAGGPLLALALQLPGPAAVERVSALLPFVLEDAATEAAGALQRAAPRFDDATLKALRERVGVALTSALARVEPAEVARVLDQVERYGDAVAPDVVSRAALQAASALVKYVRGAFAERARAQVPGLVRRSVRLLTPPDARSLLKLLAETRPEMRTAVGIQTHGLALRAIAARLIPTEALDAAQAVFAEIEPFATPDQFARLDEFTVLVRRLESAPARWAARLVAAFDEKRTPTERLRLAAALGWVAPLLPAQDRAATVQPVVRYLTTEYLDRGQPGPELTLALLARCLEPTEGNALHFRAAASRIDTSSLYLPGSAYRESAVLHASDPSHDDDLRAAGLGAGFLPPFAAAGTLTLTRPPDGLTPQQLLDLLKFPTCQGGARAAVLEELSWRYGRPFADAWEFVAFAQEQDLGLDCAAPPAKPVPWRRPKAAGDP